jgi:hypothetical protein
MRRLLALCLLASGCYSFAYHTLDGPPNYSEIAIDTIKPESEVRWSYAWGLAGDDVWNKKDLCAGQPPGKVEVELPWYSPFLMVFTLGIVVPARVTVYCSTGEGPT